MSGWTFLTNHAQVFLCIAQDRRAIARAIAAKVGITERAVQRILDDLEEAGYLSRRREGRSNVYELHPEQPLRHPAQQGHQVGELLRLLERGREQGEG
ncbi:MAG TPA: winged helix-turn-helix domain-containing protein [Roseiflexaceae bacterium]|nr:winged helix-turn-helix domain-containing protein [Roseiflexaceae bacterium]